MTDLVNWKPDGGQTAKPEDEETDKVFGGGPGTGGDVVGDVGVARPDGSDHDSYTFTSNPCLDTIPNTLPWISHDP